MKILKCKLLLCLLALLPAAAGLSAQTLVFEETFSKCDKKGGYDGIFNPSTTTKFSEDYAPGWTVVGGVAYVANNCVRLSNSSNNAEFLSPALGLTGNYTLVFEAAGWIEKTCSLAIMPFYTTGELLGGDNGDESFYFQGGAWRKCVLKMTDLTPTAQLKFTANKDKQVFLGKVRIYEGLNVCETPSIVVNEETGTEFNKTTTVEITTATEGAEIYYTTTDEYDYSDSGNWIKYEGELLVKKSCTLRAVAVKEGYVSSMLAEETFTKKVFSMDVYDYKKVTAQEEIVDGGTYLLVADAKSLAAGELYSARLRGIGVSLENGFCTFSGNANESSTPQEFTLVKSGENYYLKTFEGKYLSSATSDDAELSEVSSSSEYCSWTISLEENGAVVECWKYSGRSLMTNGDYFRNYKSDTPAYLYRRIPKTGSLTIKAAEGYATYYDENPFVMPEGVTGGIITNVEGTLNFDARYAAGNIVPAQTPLLVKAEAPGTYAFDYAMTEEAAPEDNCLYGGLDVDEAGLTYVGEGYKYYILSRSKTTGKIGFYWAAEDGAAVQYQSGMAFLALSQEAAQGNSVALVLDFDATGIEAIDNEQSAIDNDAPVFDLTGRRVLAPQKGGVYVKNGKKFMVR